MRLRVSYIIIIIGVLLRACVSAWNGFWGPSYGADLDAVGFHLTAVAYSQDLVFHKIVTGWLYAYVLGIFYFLTTPSLFLGSILSTAVWGWSAFILYRIMRLLSFQIAGQNKALLIYALWPSAILLTSVTLREAYELFFVNLVVYSTIKIYLNRSSLNWFLLAFAVAGLSTLHGALFLFGLFMVIALLFLIVFRGRSRRVSLIKLFFVVILVALIVVGGFVLFNNTFYDLKDGLVAAIKKFQEGSLTLHGRTQYKSSIEINSIADGVKFIVVSILQYWFEPMPWRVSTGLDLLAMGENILRMWLIWKAWVSWRKLHGQTGKLVRVIFMSFLCVEMLWSLGTINWGTAMRHHIPGMGLLVLSAFACSGGNQRKPLVGRVNVPGLAGE